MFVEKLSKQDIIDFYVNVYLESFKKDSYFLYYKNETNSKLNEYIEDNLSPNNITLYKVVGDKITFSVDNHNIKISDFDFISNRVRGFEDGIHNKDWLIFMANKFGDEYATAFLDFKNKEEQLKKIANNFNCKKDNKLHYSLSKKLKEESEEEMMR